MGASPTRPAQAAGAAVRLTAFLCVALALRSISCAPAWYKGHAKLQIDSATAAMMMKEHTSEGAPATPPAGPQPRLAFRCDRENAVYRSGETARISVSVLDTAGRPFTGTCSYRVTDEDSKTIREGSLAVQEGNAEVAVDAGAPGFIRLFVTVPYGGGDFTDLVTIGVDPWRIEATQTLPDDFMQFWQAQKARLDSIPPDVHRVEFDGPDPAFRYEYVDFRNVEGRRFYFVMTQPKEPGSYAVQMRIPGVGIYKRHVPLTIRRGMICVEVSIHDFPINRAIASYEEVIPRYYRMIGGKKQRYDRWENHDRQRYYYNAVILGLWRTLDIVCGEPAADQSRIIVTGVSQGGGLALALGGLDRRIDYLYVRYPGFCDHTARIRHPGRQPAWPALLDAVERPDLMDAAIAASAYYDNCNFARFITAPVFIAQGFNDRVCPPGGAFAVVSLIRSPKMFYVDAPSAHVFTSKAVAESAELERMFRSRYLQLPEGVEEWSVPDR